MSKQTIKAARLEEALGELKTLSVDLLQPGKYQPRNTAKLNRESLAELADSIQRMGVLSPILVRPIGPHRYEIIGGERRWRATQLVGKTTIPCLIQEYTDEQACVASLVDNEGDPLNEIEEARSIERYMREFKKTQEDAAKVHGTSRQRVSHLVRLLSLPLDIQELLEDGKIEFSHARILVPLDDRQLQRRLAMEVVKKKLSVIALKQKLQTAVTQKASNIVQPDPNRIYIQKIEQELGRQLGQKVVLRHHRDHSGELRIYYNSIDELHGVIEYCPGQRMTLDHSNNHSGTMIIQYESLDALDALLQKFPSVCKAL